jgi:hypothetical protein
MEMTLTFTEGGKRLCRLLSSGQSAPAQVYLAAA